MTIKPEHAQIVLRLSLAALFLWFGINQLYAPQAWIGFVPSFAAIFLSAKLLVILNGSMEIILGLMLLCGIYVRFSALILSLHLLGIALAMGYNPLTIRDIALSLATFSVFLSGNDKYCYDSKNSSQQHKTEPQ